MSTLSAGAVEHIAGSSKPLPRPNSDGKVGAQPALRKSMSRVLSRVLSITRKEQPPVQATVKTPPERAVHIDRGYEVIPRVTSTHLSKSRDGQGLSEVAQHPSYHSRTPYTTTPPPPPRPHPAPVGSTLVPRQPSVTTKLSRNQIAKFRQASINGRAHVNTSRISLATTTSTTDAAIHRAGARRHLASSRSTAEMKGRSSGETSRSRLGSWASASSFTSDPPPSPSTMRFPYVCPDRLIQRSRPNTPSRIQQTPQPGAVNEYHKYPTNKMVDASYRKPVPTFTQSQSPCSTTESPSISALTTPPQVDADPLDSLFDEIMRGCMPIDMPEPDQTSTPRPSASESLIIGRTSSQVGLLAPHEMGSGSETNSPTPTKRTSSVSTAVAGAKRFIPSGRSFEPLKSTRLSNLPGRETAKHASGGGRGGGGSRVKEAIAKFEKRISATPPIAEEPSTPVKVLGSIIERPSTVSSADLSDESRRMMWEKRQNRGIR